MTHSAIRRQAFRPNPLWLVLSLLAAAPCAANDVTFFSWSDPHYEIEHTEGRPTVSEINQLPGTKYPPLMGGTVEVPRGIIIQGDLIDDGAKRDEYPAQWSNYTADFGVRGEGRCRFPVFDGVGNHDLNPDLFIYKQIAARNRIRLEHGLIQHVSDNFQFACRTLEGDGSITARIVSASHNTANPKVGIMIRESPAADARHAALLQHRSGDLHLINRSATAGRTSQSTPLDSETPVWLRLVRRGNTFTGYHSSDGTSWQPLGKPVTVDLPGSALAGLVSTAGNRDSSAQHTAMFDQVSINQDPAENPD